MVVWNKILGESWWEIWEFFSGEGRWEFLKLGKFLANDDEEKFCEAIEARQWEKAWESLLPHLVVLQDFMHECLALEKLAVIEFWMRAVENGGDFPLTYASISILKNLETCPFFSEEVRKKVQAQRILMEKNNETKTQEEKIDYPFHYAYCAVWGKEGFFLRPKQIESLIS